MATQFGRQRIALLAIALDTSGREILEELAARPEMPSSHLHAYHATAAKRGSDDQERGEAVADGAFHWLRPDYGQGWTPASWSPVSEIVAGVEAAVEEALDLARWRQGADEIDFLDTVVIHPAGGVGPAQLPAGLGRALRRVRRRFRRISRIFLLAMGQFDTFGEAALPGMIQPLPLAGGAEAQEYEGVFDLILLQDRINLAGMVIHSPEERKAQAARMLAHLTVGELAQPLYRHIQTEQAHLGMAGRYVTVGLAEWRLTPAISLAANSGVLCRQMMDLLRADDAAPAAEGLLLDDWAGEVETRVLEEPPKPLPATEEDPLALLAALNESGLESLRSLLRQTGWRFRFLQPLLTRRRAALLRIEAQSSVRLSRFMDPHFARWYMQSKLKKLTSGSPTVQVFEEPVLWRRNLFVFCCLLCPAAIAAAVKTSYGLAASVLAGISGLGAVLLLIKGFKEKRTIVIPAPPPPASLLPELRYRRNRNWLAKELLAHWEQALKSWESNRAPLAAAPAGTASAEDSFPFSAAVCSALLQARAIHPAECLYRFWDSEPEALLAAIGKVEPAFAERLRAFARRCAGPLENLNWDDVFRAAGGELGLGDPIWREALEKARSAAIPWLPVTGSASQTFLALPRTLSAEIRSTLERHFPGQKVVEEIDGDAIVVVQVTQGYKLPAKEPKGGADARH